MTAALFALLNAARGAGELPRLAFYALCGLAALPLGWTTALAVIGGVALYLAAGWHHDACTGHFTVGENKVRWITAVTLKLLPPGPTPGWETARNRLRGTLWLSLRGLHLYPLFAALAVIHHHPAALLWGLGVLLNGPAFLLAGRLRPPATAVRLGEWLWFGAVGALVTLATP